MTGDIVLAIDSNLEVQVARPPGIMPLLQMQCIICFELYFNFLSKIDPDFRSHRRQNPA